MSIAQPPATVPYANFVAEQQARTHAEQERDQWHNRYIQEQQAHAHTRCQLAQDQEATQTHSEQEYQDLLQKVERFEQRYQCSLDTLLDEKIPPTKVPFSIYQKLLQRFEFIRKGPYKPTERLVIDEVQYQLEHPQKVDQDGYTRINYETAAKHINMSTSTPKRSIQAVLEQTPTYPLECKWNVPEVTQDGRKIECLYARAKVPSLVAASMTLTLEHQRKQGGNQYQCQRCGSTDVVIYRRLHCNNCDHETDLEPTFPNGKLNSSTGKSGKSNLLLEHDELPPTEKILTDNKQPVGMVITSDPPVADKLEAETETQVIEAAAALLLVLAGDDARHIVMPRTHESKYLEIKRPLQLSDLVEHLRGGEPRGALCVYQDGRARALCFDADDGDTWKLLKLAARTLVQAGYIVILEESPANRGGHLWIIFDGLVRAIAARAAVCTLAPELEQITEYWPGPASAATRNRVRLPGGFYARYGKYVEQPVKAWCRLANVATGETASGGVNVARLLLTSLTPAALVPVPEIHAQDEQQAPVCVVVEQDAAGRVALLQNMDEASMIASAAGAASFPYRDPEVDAAWVAKHGPIEITTLWFAITDAYSAAWFNEHNPLEKIRPLERNKKALSPNGNERTASTSYHNTPDGERYTDHSAHGRRADGTKDSGDALELASKVQDRTKSAILGETTREIISQARAAMESAARAGQDLPTWLEEIITRAGRRQYEQLLNEACGKTVMPARVMVSELQPASTAFTIYVDEIRTYETSLPYKRWCHMAVAGPVEHLHTFAGRLGLKREWFQDKPDHPHYDLTPGKRAQALKLGVVAVSSVELVKRCHPVLASVLEQSSTAITQQERDPGVQGGGQEQGMLAAARGFYERFCSQPGYTLRLRLDGQIGIGVPESVSAADFERVAGQVCEQGEALLQVLKERDSSGQHLDQAEPREPQPLVRGMCVNTPVGLATVETVSYLEAEQRWRCSVWTDDSHYAQLYVSEVQIVQQGRLL